MLWRVGAGWCWCHCLMPMTMRRGMSLRDRSSSSLLQFRFWTFAALWLLRFHENLFLSIQYPRLQELKTEVFEQGDAPVVRGNMYIYILYVYMIYTHCIVPLEINMDPENLLLGAYTLAHAQMRAKHNRWIFPSCKTSAARSEFCSQCESRSVWFRIQKNKWLETRFPKFLEDYACTW